MVGEMVARQRRQPGRAVVCGPVHPEISSPANRKAVEPQRDEGDQHRRNLECVLGRFNSVVIPMARVPKPVESKVHGILDEWPEK